jgi:hypothetical protein
MISHQTLAGAKDAFFKAMAAGWAGEVTQKTTIPEFPGSKIIIFECDGYKVVDAYLSNPDSHKSNGSTTIWYKGVPVWVMTYQGYYDKVALPFLKECLLQAYVTERKFYGGRGPGLVRGEGFTYTNQIAPTAFTNFEGEEHVFDLKGRPRGYHSYRGMSLL